MANISDVQSLAQDYFNLGGSIVKLPGDEDLNFKLKTSNGRLYTVKLMRPSCPESLIELQCAALQHLTKKELNLQLPEVMTSNNNRPYEKVSIDGQERILWILTWCPGILLADYRPHSTDLLESFGTQLGYLTLALENFAHPRQIRLHRWALTEALEVQAFADYVQEDVYRIVKEIFSYFAKALLPKLSLLPRQIIHNDANDYNVLVQHDEYGKANVSGIFDFGDLAFQPAICELAIAIAYAIMGKAFPLRVATQMAAAYHRIRPLSLPEIELLFDLMKTRLAVSVAISSQRQRSENDPYITISQAPAVAALQALEQIPRALAEAAFRQACGYEVLEKKKHIIAFLESNRKNFHAPIRVDSWNGILDLSVGSLMLGADPRGHQLEALTKKINQFSEEQQLTFTIGRYLESRRLYAAANFGASGHPTQEKRTQHLGIDIFGPAGTPVYAPYTGKIVVNTVINLPLDYGGLLILEHQIHTGECFYTLYGHLMPDSLVIPVGQEVQAGEQIAQLGAPHENGGWTPHLHWQLILDGVGLGKDFPGVAYAAELELWSALSPNPMLMVDGVNPTTYNAKVDYGLILQNRKEKLGYNLSLTYAKPLHVVAGFRQFLYDSAAHTYLDFYNNVPHVGHQHPHVVKAIQKQAALLNTNTRYLHETILRYAERLTARLPDNLAVCYFVNSASEANELAIRMARTYTQRKDIMVVEAAYHGHTNTLIDISPYKHDGPGGSGTPEWVHKVPIADDYRGKWKRDHPQAGSLYGQEVKDKIKAIEKEGRSVAAFIAETYPSVGGQIIPPDAYLREVYKYVRAHGAICIADEVQTGFGRLGQSFWAFETQGVIPDMIVLGKPIGNGFPLAAVVTTKEIARAFDNGMEYFSTFGGNPVSCAAGLAVMEVMEMEGLIQKAVEYGQMIMQIFKTLKEKYTLIGDVRGEGLFLGMELVRDQVTLEPAVIEARYIVNRLKDYHILAGIDGPLHNVLKFRPSMVIEQADLDYFAKVMDLIFQETFLQ